MKGFGYGRTHIAYVEAQVVQVDFGPQMAYDLAPEFAYHDGFPEPISHSEEEFLISDSTGASSISCGRSRKPFWCFVAAIALMAAFTVGLWH